MAARRKDRSSEEVAAGFMGNDGDEIIIPGVNDDPEPDYAALEGRTTVGTVEDDGVGGVLASLPASPMTPATESAVLSALVSALEKIASGQVNSQRAATEALDMSARLQQPDNKLSPGVSSFNPQGDREYPRPALKCPMFLPWEAEQGSLTFEEIELLNLLEEGDYAVKRNDGTKLKVAVKIKMNMNGTPDTLFMNSEAAFNEENHWMMPSLVIILRQVLDANPNTRKAANEVMTMDERVEAVRSGELTVSVGAR